MNALSASRAISLSSIPSLNWTVDARATPVTHTKIALPNWFVRRPMTSAQSVVVATTFTIRDRTEKYPDSPAAVKISGKIFSDACIDARGDISSSTTTTLGQPCLVVSVQCCPLSFQFHFDVFHHLHSFAGVVPCTLILLPRGANLTFFRNPRQTRLQRVAPPPPRPCRHHPPPRPCRHHPPPRPCHPLHPPPHFQ